MPRMKRPTLPLGRAFISSEVRENWELNKGNPTLYKLAKLSNIVCVICNASTLLVFAKNAEYTEFTCPSCASQER